MSTEQNPIDALYVAACLDVADDPQAAQIVRDLHAKYQQARVACATALAERMPFADISKGGGGLPYTAEHLSTEAWERRGAEAIRALRDALGYPNEETL